MTNEKYDASSIKILKNLEAVRQNAGLFLGDVNDGSGLLNAFRECVDNCIDEHMAGYCDSIEVTLHTDNSITVEDNGRGIPVEIKEEEGISCLQIVMCTLNAGAKFDSKTYSVSSGLHGIGISATNAVSEWLKVEVRRDDKVWFQEYARGIPKHKVKAIGQCTRKTGTKITFKPDEEIFKLNNQFQSKKILEHIRELAYLNVGLEIIFNNELDGTKEVFKDKDGLATFIKHLRKDKKTINDEVILISHKDDVQKMAVDIALQWTDSQSTDNILCYSNIVRNDDGGTHLQGFRTGINRAVNKINDEKKWIRGIKEGIKVDDTISGLYAIVSVKMPGAAYASQTKSKLINSEVKGFVDFVIFEGLYQFLSEHNRIGKEIVSRIGLSAKAREAARKAKEKVFSSEEFSSIGILPGKLADCSSKDPNERMILICEGESAAGTLKQARDRRTTAILSLRGKPLNVEKAKSARVFENEEIKNIFTSLGITMNKNGEIDCSNIRFKTVVLCADADIDGRSICCLLLTLFYRFLKPIIENGYLYIAQPPLYRVIYKKERLYLKDENALNDFRKKHGESFAANYLKGLGEMNSDDLYATLLDPEKRIWKRVTVSDFAEADSTISLLMGPDVPPRAQWIAENANYVRHIDI
jgi:DNA gyrase subunit B